MNRLLLPFLFLLAAVRLPALEWTTTHQTVQATPLRSTAETQFEFTNRTDRPVTITRVDTSCDCLDAEPDSKVIAPGATGHIRARFTVAGLNGTYHRTITVTSDDAQTPVALTVDLQVPEVASLTPRSLEWALNRPAEAKTVEIQIAAGLDLTLGPVKATSDDFVLQLETIEAGRLYRLHATPRETSQAVSAAFRIHATAGTGQSLIFSAYGNVR